MRPPSRPAARFCDLLPPRPAALLPALARGAWGVRDRRRTLLAHTPLAKTLVLLVVLHRGAMVLAIYLTSFPQPATPTASSDTSSRAPEGTHDKSGYVNLGRGAGSAYATRSPSATSSSGRSRITPFSSSRAPRTSTSDENGPIRLGEVDHGDNQAPLELVTGVIGDLRRRALLADLRPEVDRQLPGRLRASGKPSTAVIRPTRMSTAWKCSKSISSRVVITTRGYLATRAGNRFVTTAIPQRGGNTTWKRLRSRRPVA